MKNSYRWLASVINTSVITITNRWLRVGAIGGLITLVLSSAAGAAPKAELWDYWSSHQASSNAVVDHAAWADLLSRYVRPGADGVNRVAYREVTEADKAVLKRYIQMLSALPILIYNRNEQFAYWVNLYNALTVDVVLAHFPVESIRDISISPGFFAVGPWKRKLATVEGQEISLDDIEHRILRPVWRDPRIHYAVNCASLGCPNLLNQAFTGQNWEALLERGAVAFVNHTRAVRVDGDRVRVSSIYRWFKDDFGASDQALLAHLRRYAKPHLASQLQLVDDIDGYDYDWALNDG